MQTRTPGGPGETSQEPANGARGLLDPDTNLPFREVIESLDGAVALVEVNGDAGIIRYANDGFASIFERSIEDLRGVDWRTLLAGDCDCDAARAIEQTLAEGMPMTVFCPRRPPARGAMRIRMEPLSPPDEPPVMWLWHKPVGGAFEADSAALESETLRTILRSTLDPIVTTTMMGQVIAASDSIERVLGWTPAELFGRNVSVLIAPPHTDRHDGYMHRYRATGVTNILGQTRQVNALHRDGREVPIEISVSRVDLPERRESLLIGILHDITERLETERELAKYREHLEALVDERTAELEASHAQLRQADRLASIGTLAAGLGHDMGNILLPMRCRLDSVVAGDIGEDGRAHVEAVRQSVEYLQQLSNGLRLLALDPNDREATDHSTDLSSWWDQVGMLLTKSLPRHVRLAVSVPTDLPRVAVAPHRLTQAVLNLIVNAGEAVGDDGAIRVRAECDVDPAYVRLAVADNGHGMTPKVVKHALDPFFTTKKRGLGTGLGLSLVRGVVRAVGGSIDLQSRRGAGTTVTLRLPVTNDRDRAVRGERRLKVGRACISIEDPRIASLVTAMLVEAGFDVNHRTDDCPDTCVLWVTDAHLTTRDEVRGVTGTTGRRVIVLNASETAWGDTGALLVTDSGDFEALRSTIGDAAASPKGGAP